MTEDAERTTTDPTTSPSNAARVLSVLLVTPEDDLAGFRYRILGSDSTLALERLGALRAILLRLGAQLFQNDDESWQHVHDARERLCRSSRAGPGVADSPGPGQGGPASADAGRPAPVGSPPSSASHLPPAPISSPSLAGAPALVPSPSSPGSSPSMSRWAELMPPPRSVPPSSSPFGPPSAHDVPPSSNRGSAVSPWSQTDEAEEENERTGVPAPTGRPLPFRPSAIDPAMLTLPSGDPLPFKAADTPAPEVRESLSADLSMESIASGGTMGHDAAGSGVALPFAVQQRLSELDAAASRKKAAASSGTPFGSPPPSAAPPPAAATTPDPPPSPKLPALTVNQYAALCANCAMFPHAARETQASYGVPDEATRSALDAHWQRQTSADAGLKAEFDDSYNKYCLWYQRQARR